MKTKSFKKIGIIIAVMLLSFNFSFAQKRNQQGPPPGQGQMLENVIPDLTDEQATKIEAMRLEMDKKMTPVRAELEIKHAEMKSLNASDASMKEKEAKLKEINDLHYQMQLARVEHHHNVRALLNEDQQIAFDKWTLNHDKRRGMHKGHGNKQGRGNGQGYGQGYGQGNGQGNRPCPNR